MAKERRAGDGVAPACLLLQDRFGLEVNLLLFAAHVSVARGQTLTPAALDAAAVRIDAWHREVVGPLRRVRDRLKSGPTPAPNPVTTRLREQVKELEIQAEMIELDELERLTIRLETAAGDAVDRAYAALEVVAQTTGDRLPADDERDALTMRLKPL